MIRLMRATLRPSSTLIAVVVVLMLGTALGNLWLPSLNAQIIDTGVLRGDTGYVLSRGGVMLAVAVVIGAASVFAVYLSARVAARFGRDVRARLFHHAAGFSLHEVGRFGAPSLITRNTNDVQQVQMLVVMGLSMMILAPITAVGGVVMALRENVRLSGLLLVIIPAMVVVVFAVLGRAVPLFRVVQDKIDAVNGVLRDSLTGVRVVRAFVRTREMERRFEVANADLTGTLLRVNRLFALMMPLLMLVFNASSVGIIWFGAGLVDRSELTIGQLTAFLSYIMQILFSVMMATMMAVMIPRAAASAERIQAVLDTVPAVGDPAAPVALPVDPGPEAGGRGLPVRLDGVRFGYPGAAEPVLRDVDLHLPAGSVTAIVGGTGSGKTTLVNLLPRLYDVSAGEVRLGGVAVTDARVSDVRAALGVVPQKAFLFAGTVADNLRVGRADATDEELWQALDVASVRDAVEAMGGLGAMIEQGGANLSGGQRQRLAIARAVVRRPRVYVFDDCFSALDQSTEARVRARLAAVTQGATVLVVAQRISSVRDADRIVVLDGGTVVGQGTHEELLASCPTYVEIVESQTGTEAAA